MKKKENCSLGPFTWRYSIKTCFWEKGKNTCIYLKKDTITTNCEKEGLGYYIYHKNMNKHEDTINEFCSIK